MTPQRLPSGFIETLLVDNNYLAEKATMDVDDQLYTALPPERLCSPLYPIWHKVIDITFGLGGAVVLLLLFPIMALLIYLDSPGPIFYSQVRIGYQGKKFRMLKFRSMCTDAEHAGAV